MDEQDLLPGEEWEPAVEKAIKASDVMLICLSKIAVNRQGYLNREIRFGLKVAETMPADRIFLIPACLDAGKVPDSLQHRHRVDVFEASGYQNLQRVLIRRARQARRLVPRPVSQDLPRFVVHDLHKALAFTDAAAHVAQLRGTESVQVTQETAEYRIALMGADGTVRNIILDGAAPEIRSAFAGIVEIGKRFAAPIPAGGRFSVTWGYELLDSFTANTESFSHLVEQTTESLTLEVEFHSERPCRVAELLVRQGGVTRKIRDCPVAEGGRRVTAVEKPELGGDYILQWEW